VLPILTPLAVDAEHPFPFISNRGLNLAVLLPDPEEGDRFVRIKVPANRPRWVPIPGSTGSVPLEQVIAANLDLMFPAAPPSGVHLFRVTRGAESEREGEVEVEEPETEEPGSIVQVVSSELKARRFAGVVRLQVAADMPKKRVKWLCRQLDVTADDVYPADYFLGLSDLTQFEPGAPEELRAPTHLPVTHPRLGHLDPREPGALFEEIARGDLLLHHPYHAFDSSVLRFLESAAADPQVLAIKLTIYRTSEQSPIVRALAEAARRGKQVAVVVEITARFDEAPNIAWGKLLEHEGVHVAYGVERLKTHVKLALVVREEHDGLRHYVHVGTGNYHTRTAKLYEDLGLLTADEELCDEVAALLNDLTGATAKTDYRHMLVAPFTMRARFMELIEREIEHAAAGRPAGIAAKMNQLQDPEIIRALYRASGGGVPIRLIVRGLCCLRPGVAGLSEHIRVSSVVGRFLEHSRFYRFENGGAADWYIGSADWMRRNLDNRVETIVRIRAASVREELEGILRLYDEDNCSAWDCGSDGVYTRRRPAPGEPARSVQERFIGAAAAGDAGGVHAARQPGSGNGRPPHDDGEAEGAAGSIPAPSFLPRS
jgi:polyphosphate kinase